jgi:hypothetical protein
MPRLLRGLGALDTQARLGCLGVYPPRLSAQLGLCQTDQAIPETTRIGVVGVEAVQWLPKAEFQEDTAETIL